MRHLGRHVARLRECFAGLPDPRLERNRRYAMAALSVFFMQSPYCLAHQRASAEAGAVTPTLCLAWPASNATTIRRRADGERRRAVSRPRQEPRAARLAAMRRLLSGRTLAALADTDFFRSRKIRSHNCSTRKRSDATTEYFHQMLVATAAGVRRAPRRRRQAGP